MNGTDRLTSGTEDTRAACATVGHWHWLREGFIEIWLLLRKEERQLDAADPEDPDDPARKARAATERALAAHLEECAALDEGTRELALRLLDVSIRECKEGNKGFSRLHSLLLRERRRLSSRGTSPHNLNRL